MLTHVVVALGFVEEEVQANGAGDDFEEDLAEEHGTEHRSTSTASEYHRV